MAQLVKFIVGELNKPPFNLNLTNVTFNALQPSQLLQVLNLQTRQFYLEKIRF